MPSFTLKTIPSWTINSVLSLWPKAHQRVPHLICSFASSTLQFLSLKLTGVLGWPIEIRDSWENSVLLILIDSKADFPPFTVENVKGHFLLKAIFSLLLLCIVQKQSNFLTLGASRFLDSLLPFSFAFKPLISCPCRFLSYKFSINTASNVILMFCFLSLFPSGCDLVGLPRWVLVVKEPAAVQET